MSGGLWRFLLDEGLCHLCRPVRNAAIEVALQLQQALYLHIQIAPVSSESRPAVKQSVVKQPAAKQAEVKPHACVDSCVHIADARACGHEPAAPEVGKLHVCDHAPQLQARSETPL